MVSSWGLVSSSAVLGTAAAYALAEQAATGAVAAPWIDSERLGTAGILVAAAALMLKWFMSQYARVQQEAREDRASFLQQLEAKNQALVQAHAHTLAAAVTEIQLASQTRLDLTRTIVELAEAVRAIRR